MEPKRRKKPRPEQHFDDCGEDLSPIFLLVRGQPDIFNVLGVTDFDGIHLDICDSRFFTGTVAHWLGSKTKGPHCKFLFGFLALDRALCSLQTRLSGQPHFDVLELTHAPDNKTIASLRRCYAGGTVFDAAVGVDLSDPVERKSCMQFLASAKPLVLVGSLCFTGPVNEFLGHASLLQINWGRRLVVEHAFAANTSLQAPWPAVSGFLICRLSSMDKLRQIWSNNELLVSTLVFVYPRF